jgi:hypothetical protein
MSATITIPNGIVTAGSHPANPLLANRWPVTRCAIHPFDDAHETPRRYHILIYNKVPESPTMLRLEYWSRMDSTPLPVVRLDWRVFSPEEQDYEFNETWKAVCPIWQQNRQHVVAAEHRTQLNPEEAIEVLSHFNRLYGIIAMRAQEFPNDLRHDYLVLYGSLKPFMDEITTGYLELLKQ